MKVQEFGVGGAVDADTVWSAADGAAVVDADTVWSAADGAAGDTLLNAADGAAAGRIWDGVHWAVPVAALEFLVILFLVGRWRAARRAASRMGKSRKDAKMERVREQMREARGENVDMDGLMNSIHLSRGLYKELSKRCHPDRFPDPSRKKTAEELFQLITRHRRDYTHLLELRERARQELGLSLEDTPSKAGRGRPHAESTAPSASPTPSTPQAT